MDRQVVFHSANITEFKKILVVFDIIFCLINCDSSSFALTFLSSSYYLQISQLILIAINKMTDARFASIDNNPTIFDIFHHWTDWWVKSWLIKLFSRDITECAANSCKNKSTTWCTHRPKIYRVSRVDLWLGSISFLGLIVFSKKYKDDYYGYSRLLITIM